MEKPKEIKELTKLPKALQLKTKNETLFICKLIDKIKKNTIPAEFQEKAETELQKLLLKTKDATKAQLRFNIIEELDFKNVAQLFKDKAIELGYTIQENKNTKNIMENIQEQDDIETIKQHFLTCDVINGIPYVTNIPDIKIIKSELTGKVRINGLIVGKTVPVKPEKHNGSPIEVDAKIIQVDRGGVLVDDGSGFEKQVLFKIEDKNFDFGTVKYGYLQLNDDQANESKINENIQEQDDDLKNRAQNKYKFRSLDEIDGKVYGTYIPGAKIVKSTIKPGSVKIIGLKVGDMVPVIRRSNSELENMKIIQIMPQGILCDNLSGIEQFVRFNVEETEENIFTGRLYIMKMDESKINENIQENEEKEFDCNMSFKVYSTISDEDQVRDYLETIFDGIDSIHDKEITVTYDDFNINDFIKKESIEHFDKEYQNQFDEKLLPAYRNIKKSLNDLSDIADKLLEQHKEKQSYNTEMMKINTDLIDIKAMFTNMQLTESNKEENFELSASIVFKDLETLTKTKEEISNVIDNNKKGIKNNTLQSNINMQEINEKLRSVKVIFENGDEINTNMAAHLTDEEIKDYYKIGKQFNVGIGPNDNMQIVKEVIILENNTNKVEEIVIKQVEEAVQKMFIYDKNELSKQTIFEGDELPEVVIPEYNPATLKKLIENDPFLAFSYRTLMTGNETEDLDMVYKTHIKGDSDMEARLKTFESYTFSVYEKLNSKDPYATFIINSFKSINEGIGSDIVNTVSSKLHSFTSKVKDMFSLSTNDVRNEIRTLFSSMSLEEFVTKLKNSGITANDFKTNENAAIDTDLTVKEKIAKAFSLSLGGAGLISLIGSILLPTLLNISVLGKFNITYLFGVGIFLLIGSAAGLISLTKND